MLSPSLNVPSHLEDKKMRDTVDRRIKREKREKVAEI